MSTENAAQVPDEYLRQESGILFVFEAFYLESIIYAAERAVAAFERFDEALGLGKSSALDEQYEFGPLRDATKVVLERAQNMLKEGGRLKE